MRHTPIRITAWIITPVVLFSVFRFGPNHAAAAEAIQPKTSVITTVASDGIHATSVDPQSGGQLGVPLAPSASFGGGGDYSYAMLASGDLVEWGSLPKTHSSPKDVVDVLPGRGYRVYIKKDGTVWVAGSSVVDSFAGAKVGPFGSEAPVQIPDLKNVVTGSIGDYSNTVLTAGGEVWAWGAHYGTSPITIATLPPVVSVAAGYSSALALEANGSVWQWDHRRSPVPQKVALPCPARAIDSGLHHYLAICDDGSLYVWGSNAYGVLGIGLTSLNEPPTKLDLKHVVAIAAGDYYTLALTQEGNVWAWGENGGLLGDGTADKRLKPVLVQGLKDVVAIAAAGDHSMALRADGTLWAWGDNFYGQLGDGTKESALVPVQVKVVKGPFLVPYSGEKGTSGDLTVTGFPDGKTVTVMQGDVYPLVGLVSSSAKVTHVSLSVDDGRFSVSAAPNDTRFDLSSLSVDTKDERINSPGEYRMVLSAGTASTDQDESLGTVILAVKEKDPPSLKELPGELTVVGNKAMGLPGTISCPIPLRKVTAIIRRTDRADLAPVFRRATPNTTEFKLSSLRFVPVRGATYSVEIWAKTDRLTNPGHPLGTLVIKAPEYVPPMALTEHLGSVTVGEPYTLTGTVASTDSITSLTVTMSPEMIEKTSSRTGSEIPLREFTFTPRTSGLHLLEISARTQSEPASRIVGRVVLESVTPGTDPSSLYSDEFMVLGSNRTPTISMFIGQEHTFQGILVSPRQIIQVVVRSKLAGKEVSAQTYAVNARAFDLGQLTLHATGPVGLPGEYTVDIEAKTARATKVISSAKVNVVSPLKSHATDYVADRDLLRVTAQVNDGIPVTDQEQPNVFAAVYVGAQRVGLYNLEKQPGQNLFVRYLPLNAIGHNHEISVRYVVEGYDALDAGIPPTGGSVDHLLVPKLAWVINPGSQKVGPEGTSLRVSATTAAAVPATVGVYLGVYHNGWKYYRLSTQTSLTYSGAFSLSALGLTRGKTYQVYFTLMEGTREIDWTKPQSVTIPATSVPRAGETPGTASPTATGAIDPYVAYAAQHETFDPTGQFSFTEGKAAMYRADGGLAEVWQALNTLEVQAGQVLSGDVPDAPTSRPWNRQEECMVAIKEMIDKLNYEKVVESTLRKNLQTAVSAANALHKPSDQISQILSMTTGDALRTLQGASDVSAMGLAGKLQAAASNFSTGFKVVDKPLGYALLWYSAYEANEEIISALEDIENATNLDNDGLHHAIVEITENYKEHRDDFSSYMKKETVSDKLMADLTGFVAGKVVTMTPFGAALAAAKAILDTALTVTGINYTMSNVSYALVFEQVQLAAAEAYHGVRLTQDPRRIRLVGILYLTAAARAYSHYASSFLVESLVPEDLGYLFPNLDPTADSERAAALRKSSRIEAVLATWMSDGRLD